MDFRFWVCRNGRSLFGVSADILKVKFPVVICPVLTVYFLTSILLCVPSFLFCFKNRAILWVFVDLVFPCSLRPTYPSPPGVRSFLFVFSPYYLQFLVSLLSQCPPSHPTKHSVSCQTQKKKKKNLSLCIPTSPDPSSSFSSCRHTIFIRFELTHSHHYLHDFFLQPSIPESYQFFKNPSKNNNLPYILSILTPPGTTGLHSSW